ncbi:MAG: rhodanese-like domain-containing protein [Desulfobacterales bacterium]|nr:rhodanese-like domain-containing protein [Desulfobacterales bacterium]MBU8910741.1 rhodanese-like domain-containing protein [Desulfobacterales bacterium]
MKRTRRLLWVSVLLALALVTGLGCQTAPKSAEAPKADTSWQFHDIVDLKFVQKYAVMPKPANVMLIDSSPKKGKFDKGSIPTAISIPDSSFAKMTDKLPKDKNALLIFFCQGPT